MNDSRIDSSQSAFGGSQTGSEKDQHLDSELAPAAESPARPKAAAKPRTASPRKKPVKRTPGPAAAATADGTAVPPAEDGESNQPESAEPTAKKAAPRTPQTRTPRASSSKGKTAAADAAGVDAADASSAATPSASDVAPVAKKSAPRSTPARKKPAKAPAETAGETTSSGAAPVDPSLTSGDATVEAPVPTPSSQSQTAPDTGAAALEGSDVAALARATPAVPKRKPPVKRAATTAPKGKSAGAKTGTARSQAAAAVAKSPSGIAQHVAPGAQEIPPVPPLPVVPPVPPMPPMRPLPSEAVAPAVPEDRGDGDDRGDRDDRGSDDDDLAVVAGTAAAPGDTDAAETLTEPESSDAAETSTAPVSDLPADETATTPRAPDQLPPLPPMSAEEAALRFESMPDAAEQATGLEDHEPLKFVWSKRWPFLTLVPADATATDAKAPTETAHETDSVAIAGVSHDDVTNDDVTHAGVTADDVTNDGAMTEAGRAPEATQDDLGASAEPTVEDWFDFETDTESDSETDAETTVSDDHDEVERTDAVHHDDQPVAIDDRPAYETDAPSADPAWTDAEWTDAAWTGTAWDGTAWADSDAQAPGNPIRDDVTIELLTTSDTETEVFATEAPTAVLPTPDSPTELLQPLGDSTPVPLGAEGERADEPVALAERNVRAGAVAPSESSVVLSIRNLSRSFGDTIAVDGIDLDVRRGSFYGIVGPNGAGKTTTLSMVTGLLRPDSGNITVNGIDVWKDPAKAKKTIGVLPDRLRLFDRLTGAQLLYYSGVLRGLDGATVRARVKDLASAFGLEDALHRLVTDYSAGMTKKVALASAMIHSPRLLVLDEPFESVDPVSSANVIDILQGYVANGGTVVLSSHGMDLIQRVCDHVAIIVNGQVLDAGAVDDVRGDGTLEERFVELAGGRKAAEGMEWLHSFSD